MDIRATEVPHARPIVWIYKSTSPPHVLYFAVCSEMQSCQRAGRDCSGPPDMPLAATGRHPHGLTSAPTRKSFLHEWCFLNMDDITALNLRVLRRHNPNILSLIDKSSYCVVYTFDTVNQSWTKAGYEGTLFIYSQRAHLVQTRKGEEQGGEYGFCVLNRLTLDNFWGEINGGDILLEGKFIITRSLIGGTTSCRMDGLTGTAEVFGLWLYEEEDTPRIYSILQQYATYNRRTVVD